VLINEILKAGSDALIQWAEEIPVAAEQQFKRMTFQKAANAIAGDQPAKAAMWIDGHLGQSYAAGAPKAVALRWVERDPAAAMDWLVGLPEASEGGTLVKGTFKSWVDADIASAEEWALGAAPAAGVDPAVRVLVRAYFDPNPAKAMGWTHRIHTRQVRLRVQASAGRAWLRADRDAFMAWLPDSGLDDQVRDLILNTARKKPVEPGVPKPVQD
jgi:hypothetical protein